MAGAGTVSGHHFLAWSRCTLAEVVAIADSHAATLSRRADDFGIARRFASVEEMLDAGGIDALDAATPLWRTAGGRAGQPPAAGREGPCHRSAGKRRPVGVLRRAGLIPPRPLISE
jgi:hypothetical protein